MNANVNLAELIRHIQKLANSCESTMEQIHELEFYIELIFVLNQVFIPGAIENLVPMSLKYCSIEQAQVLAKNLGLHIVEGGSGTIYLSWSKGLDI